MTINVLGEGDEDWLWAAGQDIWAGTRVPGPGFRVMSGTEERLVGTS